MWFSGLRGGVAFALASVSFTNRDFVEHCGGNVDLNIENNPNHLCDNTDSEAILQARAGGSPRPEAEKAVGRHPAGSTGA